MFRENKSFERSLYMEKLEKMHTLRREDTWPEKAWEEFKSSCWADLMNTFFHPEPACKDWENEIVFSNAQFSTKDHDEYKEIVFHGMAFNGRKLIRNWF